MGYFQRIWCSRHFWFELVRSDLNARYRGSVLGVGWSLLNPIVMTCLICGIFGRLLALNPLEFAPYVLVGLAIWNYLTQCVLRGCHALRAAEGYIRQVSLPMAIYPLRMTLAAGFHLLMAGLPAVVLAASLRGFDLTLTLIWLPVALVLVMVLGWALGTVVAFHSVRFSDAPHLLEVFFQFLFYVTPVMYPAWLMKERGQGWIVDWNPVYHVLELFRRPLLEHAPPHLLSLSVVTLGTLLMIVLAIITVRTQERDLIFHL